jgi:hypothetical protein
MADSFIQVAPDGTGKKMQTALNTVSGQDVHAEAVVLVDSLGNPLSTTDLPTSDILHVFVNGSNPTSSVTVQNLVNYFNLLAQILIPDGNDETQGSQTDAAASTDTGTFSLIALFKRLLQGVTTLLTNTTGLAKNAGAANLSTTQVTATGTAATLAVARPTRRSVLFTNTHGTGSVWIGPATVTAATGQKLGPGQSCPFLWVGLFQVIDDGVTHPVVCVSDEFD